MKEIVYKGIKFKEPDFIDDTKCQYKTHQAIKKKILIRQPCEICGIKESFAHHEVYSDYLNVRWLCRSHHLRIHSIFRCLTPRVLI